MSQKPRTAEAEPGQLPPLEFLRLFRRVFSYTARYPGVRARLFVVVVLRAAQLSIVTWALAAVINGPITHGDWPGTLLGALGFLAFILFTQVTFGFRIYYALRLGEGAIRDLRRDTFAHLQQMTAGFFQQMKAGRLINRMTSDVEAIRAGVQDVLFICIVNGGQMVFTGIILAFTDWVLFLVALAIAPVLWWVNLKYRTLASDGQRRTSESFSRVTASLAESIDGIRVTQGFVRQEVNAAQFQGLVSDHSRNVIYNSRINATFLPLLEFSAQVFIALLLVVGSWRVLHGGASVGTIIQFLFMASVFFDPFRVLGTQYSLLVTSLVGAERVFRLLDRAPDWTDAPEATGIDKIRGHVEFRDVTFGYTPRQRVLNGVSFTAEPGQMVALVGHTGSGKSSIINLLTKAYLPDCGEVFIDGREIRSIRSDALRAQLGLVQQQNFLFSGTIMDNIRFARPEASDLEVIKATKALNFLDLIEALPNGFQTLVGEGGSGLSVGQRQVVCFTRALMARPRILILDEATSAIDTVTERRLQQALELLLAGRTSFVVAHRLSTIQRADQILVLAKGQIVERGTHAELLVRRGVYAGLHERFLTNTAAERDPA